MSGTVPMVLDRSDRGRADDARIAQWPTPSLFALLIAGTLALTACNSSPVSGNQSRPTTSANAEPKSPSHPTGGARSQEMVDAAVSNLR